MNLKFLIDENIKISPIDSMTLNDSMIIINSTDLYRHGTKDEILTKRAKLDELTIVTMDIRMALRSLKEGVEVIFIEVGGEVSYLSAIKHDKSEFIEMYDYLTKRFSDE